LCHNVDDSIQIDFRHSPKLNHDFWPHGSQGCFVFFVAEWQTDLNEGGNFLWAKLSNKFNKPDIG
jgi:hypothetical protein